MSEERKTGFSGGPGHLVAMGTALVDAGEGRKAAALVRQALAAAANDRAMREAAAIVLSHRVPGFHLGMLADEARNAAYRSAIERHAVGKTVLDIGAGSGLLSMIAARAGAAHAYAVEANATLAETAREIVGANGLADKVTVIGRHSTKLTREEIGGGADLIVSEIFSHHLVGEGALPSLRHAMRELGRPGARMLPASASIRVALAAHQGRRRRPVGKVEGFDLSPFNRHATLAVDVAAHDPRLELRSTPADLFAFDFAACDFAPEERASVGLASTGGRVDGAVQWIRLRLDEEQDYENVPGARSHWPLVFHPFDAPLETVPGETVTVEAWRDELRYRLWQAGTG
ncbi:MAG TPA: 50S ribosomal protein L11 methyltransferase [Allosphingosinicella sp.]|nr:50S ribosomal protein L11 methyltransferase [Allosphingosinicella sp.]